MVAGSAHKLSASRANQGPGTPGGGGGGVFDERAVHCEISQHYAPSKMT